MQGACRCLHCHLYLVLFSEKENLYKIIIYLFRRIYCELDDLTGVDIIDNNSFRQGLFYISIDVVDDCVTIRKNFFYVFFEVLVLNSTTFVGSFDSLLLVLLRLEFIL
jgi:hypothetical protein